MGQSYICLNINVIIWNWGEKYTSHQYCPNNNILNCNFDYKQHHMVGKTIQIGFISWIRPIFQYVLMSFIFIISCMIVYFVDCGERRQYINIMDI